MGIFWMFLLNANLMKDPPSIFGKPRDDLLETKKLVKIQSYQILFQSSWLSEKNW